MPENLRITTPVPNSDAVLKPNSPTQSTAVEPANPARVNRPNTQDQNTDTASMDLLLSRDSVFGKFIQQFRLTPLLSDTLGKLLFSTLKQIKANPASLPEDSVLRLLAETLPAGQGKLAERLMLQQKDSTLFSGPLFQLLDHLSEQAGDPQLDLRIAGFLKAFDGFSSAEDTTEAILTNLKTIGRQVPAGISKPLAQLAEKLDLTGSAQATEENLQVLKKEILPFLSAYVAKNSDYGKMRETLSLLLQNVAILNVSSRANLESQYRQLAAYCGRRASGPALRQMHSLYAEAIGDESQKPENRFLQSLISLLSHSGGKEHAGMDQAMQEDIRRSLLLDQSVYMPFTHIFLPAVVQDKYLFAQIWIEKKDRGEENRALRGASNPTRLYLTFDIQEVGYFEARLELTGQKVDLALSCPEKLLKHRGDIASSLGQILEKNGLAAGDIQLTRCEKPKVPELILQKVMERKRMVDVTV